MAPAVRGRTEPALDKLEVRLWLRLLGCSNTVLARLRRDLRAEFGTTLSNFDVLAQIDRPPLGPTMGTLAQRLMVSKGNVTDLVERLERRDLIERRPDPHDGRVQHVWLTPAGKDLLERMLPAHNAWVTEMLGRLGPGELAQLYHLTGRLKAALDARGGADAAAEDERRHRGAGQQGEGK